MTNYFNKQQRFSIRKFSVGVASAVLGSFLIANAPQVSADEIAVQEPTVVVEETVAEVNNNITEVAPAEVQPVNEVSVEVKTAEVAELPVVETSAVEAPAVETPVAEAPVVETRAATKRVATTRTATTRATTARTAVTRTTTPVTETATQEVVPVTVANSGEQKETKVVIKDVSFSKLFGDAKEEKADAVQESATTNLELEFQKLLEQVHSGEIMPDTDLVAQDSFTKFNARENIPSSGTYRFKERLGIKSQPKVSSANIAYYNAGQTVNYDSVLETDGHQWISYISYSGARRYIAINALATSATATNNNTTPKTTVTARATTEGLRLSIDTNQVKDKTKILYAVWSEVNGQDDLQWYTADKNGNYVVKYDNHKGLGNYHIHTYSGESGKLVNLNTLTVRVTQAMVDRAKTTTATTQEAPAQNIPSSGTYQFTGRSGVKAQPKVSSPDLAFYDKGMTVNYDSVLNSDGKQWLSYLSYDGNRRYVAIGNASTTQPATTPATSTPKPSTPTTATPSALTSPNARPQYQANTYPVGQCTWGAKQAANWVNNWWGDAGMSWINNAKSHGFTVGMTPVVGAVAVWHGHVGVVTQVVNNNQIRIVESNVNGKQYLDDHRGLFNPNVTSNGAIIGYIYPPVR